MNSVIWYEGWKKQHPGEERLMLEEVGKNPKTMYIPLKKTIRVHGRQIKFTGGTESIDPPY